MPRLSVIIPCFNNARTVREALDSALAQDHADFRVYVTDNGSSDGSAEIIGAYDDARITAALHREAVGKTENWNRAYALGGDCEYLVTLHADDRLAPGALTAIARAAERKPSLIHGRFRVITPEGDAPPQRRFGLTYESSGPEFQELLLIKNMVAVPGASIRRDLFDLTALWAPQWTFMQDVDLWWRCADKGRVFHCGQHLGDYRQLNLPPAAPRHSAEHLEWLMEKVSGLPRPGRLFRAAVDGLRLHLTAVETSLEKHVDTASPRLLEAVAKARMMLADLPPLRPAPDGRHRLLRFFYAARYAMGLRG